MSDTATLDNFDNREVGLAIATTIATIISGFILQYTRKLKNMPSYFRTHFTFFRSTIIPKNRKKSICFSHCCYLILYHIINSYPIICKLGNSIWYYSWSISNSPNNLQWLICNDNFHSSL